MDLPPADKEESFKLWIGAAVGIAVVGLTTWWLSSRETPVQNYYLFGHPIQNSPSPLLHNTGFRHYKLSNIKKYSLCETLEIKDVVQCLQHPDTFGGSVTIPHKQTIIPFLDKLSPGAKAIGAVNTVFKEIGKTPFIFHSSLKIQKQRKRFSLEKILTGKPSIV